MREVAGPPEGTPGGRTGSPPSLKGGAPPKGALAALTWQHLANDTLANYLSGVLPALAAEGIPVFLLGSLQTALILGQLFQPVSGVVADRKGGRAFIFVGTFLAAACLFGIAFSKDYGVLLAFAFLTGIGSTIFHPQALTMVRTLIGGGRAALMSVFLVGGEFGRAVGPLLAGGLVALGSLHDLAFMAVVAVITLPWLLRVVPRAERRPAHTAPLNLRRHLGDGFSLLAFQSLRAAAIYGATLLLPVFWRLHGGSLVAADSLVTVLIGLGIVGNLVGGLVADRLGRGWVLWGATLAAVFLSAGLTRTEGLWIWPVMGLLGIALFGPGSVTMLLGQDIFKENPGLGSGIALGAGNALGALLLLPISYVADHVGLEAGLWMVVVALILSLPSVPRLSSHRLAAARASGSAGNAP